MKKLIAIIIAVVAAVFIYTRLNDGGVSTKSVAGLPAPQQHAAQGEAYFEEAEYEVTVKYKAAYDITALVVSTKKYSGSSLADRIAPKDLALAWGTVAEYNDRIDFHWSQSGRWYRWYVNSAAELSPVGGEREVSRQSANNHLIASTDSIKSDIAKIKAGDVVRITGYLVDLKGEKTDGTYYTWNSSTSRDDTGDGACELIYVTGIEFK